MVKKIIMLLASCSLAVLIILPNGTVKTVEADISQLLIEPMGHGGGGA